MAKSNTVYNEINLGFARLIVYTNESGVVSAQMKNNDYNFEVPLEEIHSIKKVQHG